MSRAVLAVVLLLCATLTACGSAHGQAAPPPLPGCIADRLGQPVTVAIGARANTPAAVPLPAPVARLLDAAVENHKNLTVINVDGKPTVAFEGVFNSKAANDEALKKDRERFTSTFGAALTKLRAQSGEVDQLSAMQQAARATQPGGVVVLIDSGIQTVAPLDFRKDDLLEADPAEIRTFLDKNDLLPKLKGLSVLLVGVGNTAAPQDRLDQHTQDNLTEIWKAVATGGGASCVETLTGPNTRDAVTATPAVSKVTPPKLPTPKAVPCQDTVLPDSGAVGFRPGEDNFRDPGAARATLTAMAADINRLKLSVRLVGTTASWGSESYRIDLARRRAEAVKQVLVSLGVPGDRIATEGVGTHWPTHVPDLDEHGNLIPGPAQRNRSVVARLSCP